MSYLTVEVEIDHGRIISRDADKLPEKGSALLTILQTSDANAERKPRPFGLAKGEFVVSDEFNDPLPPELLHDFEAR
jgi:hypothetical protein